MMDLANYSVTETPINLGDDKRVAATHMVQGALKLPRSEIDETCSRNVLAHPAARRSRT